MVLNLLVGLPLHFLIIGHGVSFASSIDKLAEVGDDVDDSRANGSNGLTSGQVTVEVLLVEVAGAGSSTVRTEIGRAAVIVVRMRVSAGRTGYVDAWIRTDTQKSVYDR